MVPPAVASLGASTAWVASLFDHSPIGQALVDPHGRWLRVNPALGRMLGVDPHDLVGTTTDEVTHPDDRAVAADWARRMLEGEIDSYRLEQRYVRPDGTVAWGRLTSTLVRDALDQPRYAVAQIEDVTASRADHRFLEAILHTAASLILVLDTTGRIVRFNHACEQATGWRATEVVGRQIWDVLLPDDIGAAVRTAFADLEAVADPNHSEAVWLTRDGRELTVQWTTTLLRDDTGTVTHMVATGVDDSARRAAEAELERSDRWHRAIVEQASDVICVIDDEARLSYVSPAVEHLLGMPAEQFIGTIAIDHVVPEDREAAALHLLASFVTDGKGVPRAIRLIDAAGGHVAVEAVGTNLTHDEAVGGVIVTLRDVREREALDRRFRSAFDAAPIGMALVGRDGAYLDCNAALCEITGYRPEELLAMRFMDITHPDDVGTGRELLDRLVSGRAPYTRIEKRYVRADGDLVWVQLSLTVVRDEQGEVDYFISQVEDITERRSQTDGLAYQAHHDSLTGLLNRHATYRRLEQVLARRHVAQVAVLFADLDGFKLVNDTHGHAVGDDVLRYVARRMAATLRPGDEAGRLGGDEFVVLLSGSDLAGATEVAERLAAAIAEPVALSGGLTVQVHASVGIAMADDEVDAEALLVRADQAMYEVKRSRD